MNKRTLGTIGEKIALEHLTIQGYKHIMSNWYTKIGEIDIVMSTPDEKTIVFIEVKLRSSNKLGNGLEAITNRKKATLFKLIELFQIKYKQYAKHKIRVDVIAIDYDNYNSCSREVRHIQGI